MVTVKSAEERVKELHHRAVMIKQRRNGGQAAVFGGVSLVLLAALSFAVWQVSGMSANPTGETFAGASLLAGSTGGYVLTAVIAFFVGVVITAVIFRYRKRKR